MSLRIVAELESIDTCKRFRTNRFMCTSEHLNYQIQNSVLPLRNHDVTSFLLLAL